MKAILLGGVLFFLLFSKNTHAQIILEHTFNHGSTFYEYSQIMIVNFEVSGYRFVKIDRNNGYMYILDLDYNILKSILVPDSFLLPSWGTSLIMYLSESLFDCDDEMEYMVVTVSHNGWSYYNTYIYNEDGTLLFDGTNLAPIVSLTVPEQQYPIYNTPEGTKMILSSITSNTANVYSLCGTLSTAIGDVNNNYVSNLNANKIFPNPTSSEANIEIQLSTNDLPAILKVFDLRGNKLTEQKILEATSSIAINTRGLPAGVYYYEIENSEQVLAGEKFVVAH